MQPVYIAHKTLKEFERCVREDQGSKYRGWLGKVIPHIGDAYRTDEDAHRSHLGASQLGQDCARAIWYGFRWATRKDFSGRMVRLFNRGHMEEARFIALLLTIGCEVYQQDENGKQFRISFADGHAGGSGDGVVIGCPDVEVGVPVLGEFKTHSEDSFEKLAGDVKEWRAFLDGQGQFTGQGVRAAKFEHFVQCQTYMIKMGLAAALYIAVSKNTDDIYAEIIPLDVEFAEQFLDRGDKLVWMDKPPEKLNSSPGFWKCRFCDHRPVCHLKATPDRNCRTCAFSEPAAGGTWKCRAQFDATIDKQTALVGCERYEMSKVYG